MEKANFIPNNEITYIPNKNVEKNPFLTRETETGKLPTWEGSRHLLPKPFWTGHEDVIACHDKAWQIAFSNLRMPVKESGFVSAFIDTAFNGMLFMWDSCFILMFGRYGAQAFNFQKTLDNMYARQHKDGYICRQLREDAAGERFTRFDPCSTGPEIMAWCEWEYYKTTADKKRLSDVYYPLLAYHQWMAEHRTWRDGTYWSSGWGCGMDNQPRVQPGRNVSHSNGHMVWIDSTFQALLDAQCLKEMAIELGHEEDVPELQSEIELLIKVTNERLWSEEDAYYYDEWRNGQLSGVKSIASYWALLAKAVPAERLPRFIAHLDNEKEFKRPHRVPTMSADSPYYSDKGEYWRGSIWAPTNYMVLRGLELHHEDKLAHDIALSSLAHVTKVFKDTGTLWENYAPEFPAPGVRDPGLICAKDFVGWSGLFPISILYEYIFGIKSNPVHGKLRWDVRLLEEHGIVDYSFGDTPITLRCEARASQDEAPVITVESPIPVEIEVCWADGARRIFTTEVSR